MDSKATTRTKKDLIDHVAAVTGQSRSAVKRTIQVAFEQIVDDLAQGNRLEFREFGVFEVKVRAARIAQNPKTLEPVHVPARRSVKFKPGRTMRQRLQLQSTSLDTTDNGMQVKIPAASPSTSTPNIPTAIPTVSV